MKKVFLVLVLFGIVLSTNAQDDTKEKQKEKNKKKGGFKKENLFLGGNVTASFFSGGTLLGLSPYFGYSLNKYVDLAASVNYNYTSQRDYIDYGDKVRQTVFGPGALVRLFPVHFLFAQAQYEHNFIRLKYIPASGSIYAPSITHIDANSVLVGGGYTSGRRDGNNTFYYLSIMWDVAGVAESPYVDGLGRSIPVIRAGYNIGLFQGRHSRR